jgi:hypothetical protein
MGCGTFKGSSPQRQNTTRKEREKHAPGHTLPFRTESERRAVPGGITPVSYAHPSYCRSSGAHMHALDGKNHSTIQHGSDCWWLGLLCGLCIRAAIPDSMAYYAGRTTSPLAQTLMCEGPTLKFGGPMPSGCRQMESSYGKDSIEKATIAYDHSVKAAPITVAKRRQQIWQPDPFTHADSPPCSPEMEKSFTQASPATML